MIWRTVLYAWCKNIANRNGKSLSEISTARVFLAEEALKLGLVDKIGYLSDAVKESKMLAGISKDARVVVYRRNEFPEDKTIIIRPVLRLKI